MREIELTQGYKAQVDDEDYEYLSQWKWRIIKFKNVIYACRQISGTSRSLRMHRVILQITNSKLLVDHKDQNGLNNQRSNLRMCNRAQNRANSRAWGKSSYLGVTPLENKWKSVIYSKRKATVLGYFPFTPCGEILAALHYDEAAQKVHGEFANLNFKIIGRA